MQTDLQLLSSLINIEYGLTPRQECRNEFPEFKTSQKTEYEACMANAANAKKVASGAIVPYSPTTSPVSTGTPAKKSKIQKLRDFKKGVRETNKMLKEETGGFGIKKIIALLLVIGLGLAIYFRPETAWLRDWISNNNQGVGFYVMVGVCLLALFIVFK